MQALLEHSQKNYGPLPSELRPRRIRSRTYSRPSPYPARIVKHLSPPDEPSPEIVEKTFVSIHQPLQAKSTNIMPPAPALGSVNPISPFVVDFDRSKKESANVGRFSTRPRVTSSARRSALGWAKRSTGKSADLKENASIGMLTT
jgi:serine/arginine repetitive matrix protein 2